MKAQRAESVPKPVEGNLFYVCEGLAQRAESFPKPVEESLLAESFPKPVEESLFYPYEWLRELKAFPGHGRCVYVLTCMKGSELSPFGLYCPVGLNFAHLGYKRTPPPSHHI